MIRRFEDPDEMRTFAKGRFEVVRVPGSTLGRATYQPGWRWSTDVGAATGQALCPVAHVGVVLSGRAAVEMADGRCIELRPGDLFVIEPGHDSWVVGDEPYVSLHLGGAESYAAG